MDDDSAPVKRRRVCERIKRPVGRPRKVIDHGMLERLGQSMLSVETIAEILECHVDTLHSTKEYSEILHKARANRKFSLVEIMWDEALNKRNYKMMIWLSKQHLGYRDVLPIDVTQVNFNVYCKDIPKNEQELIVDDSIEVIDDKTKE
jgi:hypothetical protein